MRRLLGRLREALWGEPTEPPPTILVPPQDFVLTEGAKAELREAFLDTYRGGPPFVAPFPVELLQYVGGRWVKVNARRPDESRPPMGPQPER